jgi:hypothetical protein
VSEAEPTEATPDGDASARDRRIVRRGLLAGGAVGVGLAALLGIGLAGAGAAAIASGLWLGLAVGGFVAAGWLLLALGLDLMAGDRPSGRRLAWTAGVSLVALILPFLALAAGTAPPS